MLGKPFNAIAFFAMLVIAKFQLHLYHNYGTVKLDKLPPSEKAIAIKNMATYKRAVSEKEAKDKRK